MARDDQDDLQQLPYRVRDAKQFDGVVPGDLINATLVIVSNDAYLKDVKKVGSAPLEQQPGQAAAPSEPEIAAFDGVEEHGSVELVGGHERERGIAFELGQSEIGPQRRHHRADEVRQDVLRVVQLDVGQISGVAGDVGNQKAGGLRDREHRSSRGSGSGGHRTGRWQASTTTVRRWNGTTS